VVEFDHFKQEAGLHTFLEKRAGIFNGHLIVIKESAPDESSAEMLRLFSSMDERTKEIMLIQMRALVSAKR
jgi:hypothetical protein